MDDRRVSIPENKKYFRIGEVARIVGVEPYVLRYWEGEFPQLRPSRADSNQRIYQRKDIETLLVVKRLLYEEKLTIEGAKKRLKEAPPADQKLPASETALDEIKRGLLEVIKILS